MATTLTYGSTTLSIPEDMLWSDEFEWTPVDQAMSYTITGALIVQSSLKQAGRPITLQSGANYGWIDRATLLQVSAWSQIPGAAFTLVLRGTSHNVAFDHLAGSNATLTARKSKSGAVFASAVEDYTDVNNADFYVATFRFIEV